MPQIRQVSRNENAIFLFLQENICCGYSLEESYLFSTSKMFSLRKKNGPVDDILVLTAYGKWPILASIGSNLVELQAPRI